MSNRAERRAAARAPEPPLGGRYGSGRERRALLPAIVGALVLLAGLLLVGQPEAYLLIRFAVSVLALITAVFVAQAKRWAWLPVPLVVAVLWNPVLPFAFTGQPFRLGHLVAAAALLATGVAARA